MESILTSVKKVLGIQEDYEHFDADIIMHINTVFATLHQLGVGPDTDFVIFDKTAVWSDFIEDKSELQMVKTYMGLKVRLIFDPPQSTSILEAYKSMCAEYEWRLNAADDDWADPVDDVSEEVTDNA
jgi:hypothetical protein